MNDYLKKLIFGYLYIHSLSRQVTLIKEWEIPSKLDTLNTGSHFFSLTLFSFGRTILLELCKFVSNNEEKSLIVWLHKAKENAKELSPSLYNKNSDDSRERIPLTAENYIKIIDEHLDQLQKHNNTIKSLKGRRDKVLAHTDKAFFNNPTKVFDKYPLSNLDINALMNSISEILSKHHLLLLHGDANMGVESTSDVDKILNYVRAFARVRKDKKVTHDCKIMVYKYLRDDYQENSN